MFVAKQKPYFNDYDENKKFLSVLFKPSMPLQSRELHAVQSILQGQIERFGSHQFKAGARVLDGEMSFDTGISYVKIDTSMRDPSQLIGRTLTGTSSKVKGTVAHIENASGDDPTTMYVRFVAGDSNTGKTAQWAPGESFEELAVSSIQILDQDDAIGIASVAQIERGIYYIHGYFALVDAQTLVLDKYDNVPSYRIGLQVFETIVTPEEDKTLLDNAIGSYNYAAPGAHRFKMELKLAKVDLASKVDNDKFIELGQIQAGRIIKQQTKTEYNELEKTLARRTYDESGDYTVRPFKACVREHRSNDRGQWKAGSKYLVGDVVRNHGNCYTARTAGTSPVGDGPNWTDGKQTDGGVQWEFTPSPKFNNGVYPAEGKVVSIDVIDGGNGYVDPPFVSITSNSGSGASATAVISEGKVVRVLVDSYGSGYLFDDVKVTFEGGHGRTDGCICPGSEDNAVKATATVKLDSGNPNKIAIGLESGKAYVRGFEIEKVGTSWISIDKARETASKESVLLTPSVGNYIRVSNIVGVPPLVDSTDAGLLAIYDQMTDIGSSGVKGNQIGTCRCRGLEWDNGAVHDPVKGVYRLYIYDIRLNDGVRLTNTVKSFIGKNGFSCNIDPVLTQITGGITSDGKGVITGSGTSFRTELMDNDYIKAGGDYYRCVVINGQNKIQTDSRSKCDNLAAYLCTTEIVNPQGFASVYRFPDSWIQTTVGEQGDDFDADYTTMELVTGSGSVVDGRTEITFVTPSAEVKFANTEERDNHILFVNGKITPFTATNTGEASRSLTVSVAGTASGPFQMLATLRKSGGSIGLRTKTSKEKKVTITKSDTLKMNTIPLGVADVYRIGSVRMYNYAVPDSGTLNENSSYIDITDRFDLITGQTASYYGESYLKLKSGYSSPERPIVVYCHYFEHSKSGDYFTVDSYDCPYEEIPSFEGINLRDVIDFRPNVVGANGRSYMIKSGTEIEMGYRFYLARRDKICLDYRGNFVDVKGIPAASPQAPATPNLSMNVYDVDLFPYTLDASNESVNVNMIDNRRYTMRDIGKLETRIDRLEEYTALSLLEQQTESMNIQDSDGMDRFKQGFIVDNFQSGGIASLTDPSVACCFDNERGICRPPFTQNSFSLSEYTPVGADLTSHRASNNYMAYGKVFTLPLDPANPHVPIVEQSLATRIQNINPFAIAAFVGSLTVNPSSDDWFESEYLPDVVTQVEGDYLEKKNSLEGTRWNSWQSQWFGQPVTTNSSVLDHTTGRAGKNLTEHWKDTSVTTQQVGQSRNGIKTTVTSKIDYEVVGDRIVSTSSIPYMRSRWLLIKAKNLKPYTRYYPFFDNVQVDYWCVPASRVEFKPNSVTGSGFDGVTAAGNDAGNNARKIIATKYSFWPEQTDRTCLDIGDVVVATTGGNMNTPSYTAVCVGTGKGPSEQPGLGSTNRVVDYMYVVNMKNYDGTALTGNSANGNEENSDGATLTGAHLRGSISGATGEVAWAEGNRNHAVGALKTNAAGELYFMFWIPDGDKIDYGTSDNKSPVFQFRCGDRVFSLSENSTKNDYNAEVVYSAIGTYNKRERSVNAVRNAVVNTQYVSEDRTITNTLTSTTSDRAVYRDPLAQTFLIGTPGGCFISKVDIFFASVPDDTNPLPVTLQIRTVENGIPTSKVLPFGEVTLRPDQINLSSETIEYVDSDGQVVKAAKYDVATTFEFESPVYCEDTSEYAVVLLSDSNDYNVWIAQVGELVPGTTNIVSKQPYTGVLLKSQNASTWTPDQTQDLKMVVYRANFHVADSTNNGKVIGNLQFAVNDPVPRYLSKNCFQTKADSGLVRVHHPNHGLITNMKAVITRDDINEVDSSQLLSGTITTNVEKFRVVGVNTRFTHEIKKISYVSEDKQEHFIWPTLYTADNQRIGIIDHIEHDTVLYLAKDTEDDKGADVAIRDGRFQVNENVATIGGIPYSSIVGTHTVVEADLDSYVIDLGSTTATTTGYYGDGKFKAEGIFNYDTIHPSFNTQTFGDTAFDMTLNTMTGTSGGRESSQELVSPFGVVMNDNNQLIEPMAIWNRANLRDSAKPSLIANVTFSSTNPALTPVIDSDRMSAIAIGNIINHPDEQVINNDVLDVTNVVEKNNFGYYGRVTEIKLTNVGANIETATVKIGEPTGIDIDHGGIQAEAVAEIVDGKIFAIHITNPGAGYKIKPSVTIETKALEGLKVTAPGATAAITIDQIITEGATSEERKNFENIIAGQYIEVVSTGATKPYLITNKIVNSHAVILFADRIANAAGKAPEGTKMNIRNRFTEEISPIGGSVHAKYITRPINMQNTCNMAKIMFAACVPKMSSIDVYCKAYDASGGIPYNEIPWELVKTEKGYPLVDIGSWKFTDVDYVYDNDKSFDTIAVKIVFKSYNSSSVPMIRDFRVIGCI